MDTKSCRGHRVFGYAVATQWIRSKIEGKEYLSKAQSFWIRIGYAVDTQSNRRQRVFVKGTEFFDTQWKRSQIEGTEFLDAQWIQSQIEGTEVLDTQWI